MPIGGKVSDGTSYTRFPPEIRGQKIRMRALNRLNPTVLDIGQDVLKLRTYCIPKPF